MKKETVSVKTHRNYPVLLEKSIDGFYLVQCPIIDDCYSEGKTMEEALVNIKDIIELRLEEGIIPSPIVSEYSMHTVAI